MTKKRTNHSKHITFHILIFIIILNLLIGIVSRAPNFGKTTKKNNISSLKRSFPSLKKKDKNSSNHKLSTVKSSNKEITQPNKASSLKRLFSSSKKKDKTNSKIKLPTVESSNKQITQPNKDIKEPRKGRFNKIKNKLKKLKTKSKQNIQRLSKSSSKYFKKKQKKSNKEKSIKKNIAQGTKKAIKMTGKRMGKLLKKGFKGTKKRVKNTIKGKKSFGKFMNKNISKFKESTKKAIKKPGRGIGKLIKKGFKEVKSKIKKSNRLRKNKINSDSEIELDDEKEMEDEEINEEMEDEVEEEIDKEIEEEVDEEIKEEIEDIFDEKEISSSEKSKVQQALNKENSVYREKNNTINSYLKIILEKIKSFSPKAFDIKFNTIGIFKKSGNITRVNKIWEQLNNNKNFIIDDEQTIFDYADVFKRIVNTNNILSFLNKINSKRTIKNSEKLNLIRLGEKDFDIGKEEQNEMLNVLLENLTKEERENGLLVIRVLREVVSEEEVNNMSSNILAGIFTEASYSYKENNIKGLNRDVVKEHCLLEILLRNIGGKVVDSSED